MIQSWVLVGEGRTQLEAITDGTNKLNEWLQTHYRITVSGEFLFGFFPPHLDSSLGHHTPAEFIAGYQYIIPVWGRVNGGG